MNHKRNGSQWKLTAEEKALRAQQAKDSQALVELVNGAELFHDGAKAYATVLVEQHPKSDEVAPVRHFENQAINSDSFKLWLGRRCCEEYGRPPGAQALRDALAVLTGRALFDGPQRTVAVRIAEYDGAIYLDLANSGWESVKVTNAGWTIVEQPPVKFIRPRGMQALPAPTSGKNLGDLRRLLNAGEDETWQLMVGWLIGAIRPQGPYPLLCINGEQGSCKSTACRMLRRLIDPNEADLRAAPHSERDLMIAAANAWIMGFDNLSGISPALSDSLCRLATGGGFSTRQLFTDSDEKLFQATRPILCNGIDELIGRPDLLERSIVITLPTISATDRKSESELWQTFEEMRPGLLGALLDAASVALRDLPEMRVNVVERPRMADFAEWVAAAERALPWRCGEFVSTYANSRSVGHEIALEGSPIGEAVLAFAQNRRDWDGTASELLLELAAFRAPGHPSPDWPKTPKGLANALRRIAPTLRRFHVDVEMGRREPSTQRRRLIRLTSQTDSRSDAGRNGRCSSSRPSDALLSGANETPAPDCLDDADRQRPEPVVCATASS